MDVLDLTGKNVDPGVTYAVSGSGTAERDHTGACPGATLRPGLAVLGEEVAGAGPELHRWLTEAHLL